MLVSREYVLLRSLVISSKQN